MIEACGRTDKGPVRMTNEDSFASEKDLSLFVVADGLGGHVAGDVASRIAVETMVGFIRRTHQVKEFTWPCGLDLSQSHAANRLRTGVQLANERLFRTSRGRTDLQGMGTTVVSALITGSRLVMAHVGDSRLYSLAGGVLRRLTRDDSWHEHAGDAETHALTNALGIQQRTQVSVREHDLVDNEILLFCTDGLHGVVDDSNLAQLMRQEEELSALSEQLVSAALAAGTRDNVTALLVRYQGHGVTH